VVDAASARLWYYQGGEEVGSMKVVVGTEATQTPQLVGSLTWAIVNPYWNVPDYLVRENIARKVLSGRTLRSMNMQVLSDWSENAQVVDPKTVDWQAVADGRLDVRVRELPGPVNSMGKVKFLFPNDEGIYLHDTPATDLFKLDDRHKSNGCIRLEKASALGRWMMGDALNLKAKGTEVPVAIPASVPVYLTYLTPVSSKQGVALRTDIYGLDRLN
jgi:murein L,D-transpeptidase YcbB/YkuD